MLRLRTFPTVHVSSGTAKILVFTDVAGPASPDTRFVQPAVNAGWRGNGMDEEHEMVHDALEAEPDSEQEAAMGDAAKRFTIDPICPP